MDIVEQLPSNLFLLVEGKDYEDLLPLYSFIEDHTIYDVSPFYEGLCCFGIHIRFDMSDQDMKESLEGLSKDIKKLFNFDSNIAN